MKDIHKDCQWQTRDILGSTTNPLQYLVEMLTGTAKDMSELKMDAALYGIIVGWDDESYAELKEKHNWSDEHIENQKRFHQEYIKAWNAYMGSVNQTP